jgi:hypothetical protein
MRGRPNNSQHTEENSYARFALKRNEDPRLMFVRPSPRLLAPDWRTRIRSVAIAGWLSIAGLLLFAALRDPRLIGWVSSAIAVLIVITLPNGLARLNARISISNNTVEYRGALRRRQRCARDAIQQVVRVRIAVLGSRFVFTRLLLVDAREHALITVQEEWWSSADLERVWNELAVPVSTVDKVINPKDVNRRFPGAASFLLVHRFAVV